MSNRTLKKTQKTRHIQRAEKKKGNREGNQRGENIAYTEEQG